MFSILLTPLLMLLSVFGLSLLQHPHWFQSQRAVTLGAPRATSTISGFFSEAVVEQAPPSHTSSSTDEAHDPASRPGRSGLATGAQPSLTPNPALEPKPNVTPKPTTDPEPAIQAHTDFASQTEARIRELTNAERVKEGLGALKEDAYLAMIARAHSADMIARDFFDHNNPDGCSSSCRANNADYTWSAIGENIYMTEGYDLSADDEAEMVVDGWMHSAGHRANILGAKYTNSGVGVVVEGEAVYITALYSRPR